MHYTSVQRSYVVTPHNQLQLQKQGDLRMEGGFGSHLWYMQTAYSPLSNQAVYVDIYGGGESAKRGGMGGFDVAYGVYRHVAGKKVKANVGVRAFGGQYWLDSDIFGRTRDFGSGVFDRSVRAA